MGQDRGLWFPPTQRLNSLASLALDPNLMSKTWVGTTDMFSTLGSNQDSVQLLHSYFDGSHGWFHSQRFLPLQKPCIMKMPLAGFLRNQVDSVISKAEGECNQKRFLVFDQSGDQTNLVLTSDIKKSFGSLKQPNMKEDLQRSKKDLAICQEMMRISEPDWQSEKQEDTDELNALLYSDDESDCSSDEDEVTSSRHSPSTMSVHGDQETFVRSHAKKRKVLENMLDAESSCGFLKRSKPSSNKIGEEKIFETINLLRSIIPGEELMDPIVVIDRAINYLISLKMEAENGGYGTLCMQDT
uniref:BHLH domain-containing protein n=1 Tax=Noccaea caerulescens TaxID=107243 RepID=A0A1J3HH12_NOCCA